MDLTLCLDAIVQNEDVNTEHISSPQGMVTEKISEFEICTEVQELGNAGIIMALLLEPERIKPEADADLVALDNVRE